MNLTISIANLYYLYFIYYIDVNHYVLILTHV